jgi:hypothetical protein
MIKVPRVVLSGWSEWAEARKKAVSVDPARIGSTDARIAKHPWHQPNEETRPNTPTPETLAWMERMKGE